MTLQHSAKRHAHTAGKLAECHELEAESRRTSGVKSRAGKLYDKTSTFDFWPYH